MKSIFHSSVAPLQPVVGPALWFVYQRDRLLVQHNETSDHVPQIIRPEELGLEVLSQLYLGQLGLQHCFAAELAEDAPLPDGMGFYGLRKLFGRMDDDSFSVAMRAVQLVAWIRDNQYCGRCATPMETKEAERARQCPACGLTRYPRISPAIIVAVVKDGRQLLMARGHRYPLGWYSVLAGFVEPGETLEETVAREVKEEVGIDVANVRYFGSQPWPFPDSLMVAFTAQYDGGEIVLEEAEIADARWFSLEEMPELIPSKMSISRRLIDWFIDSQSR